MLSRLRAAFRLQESGLILVIIALGLLMTAFSGTVKSPLFERGADGARHRVFAVDSKGERVAQFTERNKFLNAQNLAQLAKDTSFTAIMAVRAAVVIISGRILDLARSEPFYAPSVSSGRSRPTSFWARGTVAVVA